MSNEKVSEKVQEAIFTQVLSRPANSQCADCPNRSPTWVSLDFGVFLCIRCSGVHRQIGPHITRVRSARLDGWTKDNIEIMSTVGNKIANDYYEHRLPGGYKKPTANSSMEDCRRFVDDKYIRKTFAVSGYQPPVKEFLACRTKGTKPDFSYSSQGQGQQQGDHARHHSNEVLSPQGQFIVRKKSMSLDKGRSEPAQKAQQHQIHQNHDLLSADDDLFGKNTSNDDFGDFKQAHHHAQSASPVKHQGLAEFQKTNSQQETTTTQWDWNFTGNINTNQNSTQSVAPANTSSNQGLNFPAQGQTQQQLAHQQQQQQQQQQQPKVNLMSLYNQGGQSNTFGQQQANQNWNFQGVNQGFQGGMNNAFNGAQMGFQQNANNFGNQQRPNQQMGGFPQQQMGFNANMGGFPQMGYNQGLQQNQGFQQNQFGFNQYQNNGFVQQQNTNKFF